MKSRTCYRLLLTFAFITSLLIFYPAILYSQGNGTQPTRKSTNLIDFAKQRNKEWMEEKKKADSLANRLQFPIEYLENDSRVVKLQRLGLKNKPVYYATENISAASLISTNQLWTDEGGSSFLTGEGVDINVWDGGAILTSHQEFKVGSGSRIEMRNRDLTISNHSTHIAGTMAATGIVPEARGMAPETSIFGWDFNNDFAEMSVAAADGMVLSNHSYGSINGWDYNSSNEMWYWYGDTDISQEEDYEFGFYNQVSADLDHIAWLAPYYLIVKSAGNDRGEAPETQPIEHLVWDEAWVSVTVPKDADGGLNGYDCLTPMSVAKNTLTIGAVDEQKAMTSFSAFGPTDDGRIKPDLVANGTTIYSTLGSSVDSYGNYNGTSMAAASTTGSLALLYQLQQMLQPETGIQSSSMKGLLIHTATEMGTDPGPDFQHGWGLIDMKAAARLLQDNVGNGGMNIREDILQNGETKQYQLKSLSDAPFLKVTLCWTDPAGNPSEASLNPRQKKLVNDLNLSLENVSTSQVYHPWILDWENPGLPASRGENQVDNVEQVVIPNPGSGAYTIYISHSGSITGNSQPYSLIISGISTPEDIPPPRNLRFSTSESSVILSWDAPEGGTPEGYHIYRDGNFLVRTQDLSFNDVNLVTDNVYIYYTTALYERNGSEVESLPTNQGTTTPRSLRPLPYGVDFEDGTEEIVIKSDPDGWQLGNSVSLSNYYLDFASNETRFIAASSYSAGETSHVKDIATTMPLRLAEYTNVKLNFDYMLITGLYSSIDELHVVYKLQDEHNWHEWHKLPLGLDWTTASLDLPENAYRNGIQIGFYYDDFYQKGMGAGLDNISLTGVQSESTDLAISKITKPVSSCILSASEEVTLTIENTGTANISAGEIFEIHMEVSEGTDITDQLILTNTLAPGSDISHTMSKTVNMSEPGSYTFEFKLDYGNDSNPLNNSLETEVEVGGSPQPVILNSDHSFCVAEDPVEIQVAPTGGSLSGPGVTGMFFDPAVAGVGTHTLVYTFTDDSGCQGTTTEQVTVSPLPVASILNTNLSFCVEGAPVEIQVAPTGGSLSGPGVVGIYFCPEVAGVGSHTITYTVTLANGCAGTASKQVEVSLPPEAAILNSNSSFCLEATPVKIRVSPEGGILSGPGVLGMYFYPAVAGVGSHTISYIYSESIGCKGLATMQVEVSSPPRPSILNEDLEFCENHLPVLINAVPLGGVLEGPGCDGNYFFPDMAGPGVHTITYSYTDAKECIGSCSRLIEVLALPKIEILTQKLDYCEHDPPVEIRVNPEGGKLSGPGVNSYNFSPVEAGTGLHTLTYTYGDLNGCVNSIKSQLRIKEGPMVDLGPDINISLKDTFELWPVTNAPVLKWFDGSEEDHLVLTGGELGTGTFEVWVKVTSLDTCTDADTISVTVVQATEMELSEIQKNYVIYPNPVHDGFYIKLAENEHARQISIFNQTGQIIMNHIPNTYPYFNTSHFHPGSYILKLKSNERIIILKFIKL